MVVQVYQCCSPRSAPTTAQAAARGPRTSWKRSTFSMAAAAHLRWRAIDCVLWHQGSLVAPGAALGLSRAAGAVPVALALLTGRPCLSSSISSASAAWCPSQRLQHRAARRRLARRRPWPPLRAVADEEQLASASPAAVQQHDHDSDALLEARAPEDGGLPSALPAPGAWAGMVAAWPQQQLEPALYIVPTPIGEAATRFGRCSRSQCHAFTPHPVPSPRCAV